MAGDFDKLLHHGTRAHFFQGMCPDISQQVGIIAIEVAGVTISVSFNHQLPGAVPQSAAHFGAVSTQGVHQIVQMPDGQSLSGTVSFQVPIEEHFIDFIIIVVAHGVTGRKRLRVKGLQTGYKLQVVQTIVFKK